MILVFGGFKSGIRDLIFVMLILSMLVEAYRPSNLHGFEISCILSCQLKILLVNSCTVQKKFNNL